MDLKEIEEFINLMDKHHLKKVSLKRKDFELVLEKEGAAAPFVPPAVYHHPPAPSQIIEKGEAHSSSPTSKYITSPIVGTFYQTPSPNDPAYVKVGDEVDLETVVCIVEAMKVMNEVKAAAKGVIAEILVKNGEPVEYGTKLFRLS